MKKILLSACAILVASATFAQSKMAELPNTVATEFTVDTDSDAPVTTLDEKKFFYQAPIIQSNASSALPIWEEDFSGGFPQGWSTYTSNTQGGVATCPWVYTTDGSWGYFQGSQGASAAAGINSTTALNGFLISDTDSANHHSYGQPSGTTYEYIESYFTTSAINLSLNSAVNLEFEHSFRYNNLGGAQFTPPTVSVSSDSITWTNYLVNAGIPNNTNSLDPEILSLNISSVAANQSTVYIKIGWTSRVYFWMIDDMRIIETPANLMDIEDAVTGGYWIDYQNYSASGLNTMIGLDYTVTPVDQVNARPFSCEAVIRNTGGSSQSAVLKYDVTGSATYSGSSVATILAGSDSAVVAATPTFSPGIGNYVVEMWAEADSAGAGLVTTNSAIETRNIEVSQYLYAKDEGAANLAGAYDVGDDDDQNQISTRFEIYENADLYSLRVFIDDGSTVGAKVYAVIYESDSTASNGVFFLDKSDDYTLTAQDLGNWIDVPFLNPISLFEGYAYEFGVGGYQHPVDISRVGTTANPALYNGEHSSFDELGLSTQSAGIPTWYYITSTPMVRMNFEPIIPSTISEFGVSMFDVYPNPSLGLFTISLEESSEFAVSVINVLGQTVFSTSTDGMNTSIDLSSFDKGIYTVELKDENAIYTEKIIVE
jgi:hypothetical protein